MKLKYLLSIIAIAALTVSCADFLNLSDPDKITTGNYYQTEEDIQASVFGVYAQISSGYFYGTGAPYFQEDKARILFYPDTGVNAGENASFDNCSVMASNQFVLSRWNAIYNCIDRANVVLKHLDDATYSSESVKKGFEGEARFVRALCYYNLVSDFGEVPLVLQKLESLAEVNAANVRQPKADVYQAIFDDCKWVIDNSGLPDLQGASGCGRASKVAAMALWAKALLQKATDEDFASEKVTLSKEAVTLLSNALGKAKFSDFTTVDLTEIWDVAKQPTAQEAIFQLNFLGGSSSNYSSYNGLFRAKVIDDPSKEVNKNKAGGSFHMQERKTLAIYDEPEDLRFTQLMALGSDGVIPEYYTLKYRDTQEYASCNCIILRYADVVAMLAEANFHAGNASEAVKYVNMLRKRAGLGNTTATSGTALRDVIYKERQREFVYEFMVWSDMKRGFSKAEVMQKMKADGADMYGAEDWLLPIPATQSLLNPEGLYQNPGY